MRSTVTALHASGSNFRHSQVAVHGATMHVLEAGDPHRASFLFLHGWPASWRAWQAVMDQAAPLWHFAFHSIPRLPEALVQGRQAVYFAFFYDALSVDAATITPERCSADHVL